MFLLAAPHALYVVAAYALLAVFIVGYGIHGWRCWQAVFKQKNTSHS